MGKLVLITTGVVDYLSRYSQEPGGNGRDRLRQCQRIAKRIDDHYNSLTPEDQIDYMKKLTDPSNLPSANQKVAPEHSQSSTDPNPPLAS